MGLLRGREGVVRDGPAVAYLTTERYPLGQQVVTVDLANGPWANFYGTLYSIAMQRTYVAGGSWYAFLDPKGGRRTLADLEHQLLGCGTRVRFVIADPKARFLVTDSGSSESDDEGAMTNVEAARYLASKYPTGSRLSRSAAEAGG